MNSMATEKKAIDDFGHVEMVQTSPSKQEGSAASVVQGGHGGLHRRLGNRQVSHEHCEQRVATD